ncbi:ABC transporter ATP-binding protein [Lacticaseibacillus mingshuiensis]|uniref:ABC transporter ATP-binding protein n=1 Tax=Lacticaseibacillus mingshuiensis TaxID=2799574 RepID=A0ABW4CHM4_9LACO|nr:ABC transporter ATP-binding protein [Lacticaseibacillus mingshuiensis]
MKEEVGTTAILTVQDLNKSFGGHQVLHGVDFALGEGHVVGLVGPNGAGKSTIMKAVLGLIPTDGGTITIGDKPVSITSHQALKDVGALIEYPGIYPFLTGRQHLELYAARHHRAQNITSIVEALGMTKYINVSAKSYSLGMKQKLGIAQALVDHPKLVILDEPMNGLDPQAVKDLRDIIRKRAADGTSFLISSHILSELEKVADDVLVLNHGHIVQESSMAALADAGGAVYRIATADDEAAVAALAVADVTVSRTPAGLILRETGPDVLNTALAALVGRSIQIRSIEHVHRDLETSFLDMVAGDGKEASHK